MHGRARRSAAIETHEQGRWRIRDAAYRRRREAGATGRTIGRDHVDGRAETRHRLAEVLRRDGPRHGGCFREGRHARGAMNVSFIATSARFHASVQASSKASRGRRAKTSDGSP